MVVVAAGVVETVVVDVAVVTEAVGPEAAGFAANHTPSMPSPYIFPDAASW